MSVGGGAGAGLFPLAGFFKEELADLAGGQAEGQVVVGAMLFALVAGAGGFAARQELLDAGDAQHVVGQVQLAQESRLAVAQG